MKQRSLGHYVSTSPCLNVGTLTHQCLRVTSWATKRHVSHMPPLGKAQFQELGICELMLVQQTLVRGVPSQVYSMAPTTPEDVDRLPTRDYLFCYEARGRVHHYSAHKYNGTNIGRFVNQGGLLPAFRRMVSASNKYIHPSLQERAVEEEANKHCNVQYHLGPHRELVVELKERMHLGSEHKELLANYGIMSYWVPYVCSHASSLGEQSELVQAILWCTLSGESNWTSRQRQEVRQLLISGGVDLDQVEYECPWPELVYSSTRQRKIP